MKQGLFALTALLAVASSDISCATDAEDLSKKVANPISDLVSVPLQFNYDCCYGVANGGRFTLNIQPVIPFDIGHNWTLVTRTILPVINQWEATPGTGDTFGLGDTTQSFFIVPPAPEGVIFGLGPAFLWPTDTSPILGARKWGVGPTLLLGMQQHGWTYGILTNHIWSYAGPHNLTDVSATFLQPFLNYTFPDTTQIGVNSESTYDWIAQQWTAPINLTLSKILKFGGQPVSLGVASRYYIDTPSNGPRWGIRMTANFLFPG